MKKFLSIILFDILLVMAIISFLSKIGIAKFESKDIILYLAPSVALIARHVLACTALARNLSAQIRNYLSRDPIFWDFSATYQIEDEIFFKELKNNLKDKVLDIAKKDYSERIRYDIDNDQSLIFYLGGVRFSLKFLTPAGMGMLSSSTICINFSSESPLKTFKRKHEKILIKPTIKFITEQSSIGDSLLKPKYELTANKTLIPIDLFSKFESDYDIINYSVDIKPKHSTDSTTSIQFKKNKGFYCSSASYNECFDEFNNYILV